MLLDFLILLLKINLNFNNSKITYISIKNNLNFFFFYIKNILNILKFFKKNKKYLFIYYFNYLYFMEINFINILDLNIKNNKLKYYNSFLNLYNLKNKHLLLYLYKILSYKKYYKFHLIKEKFKLYKNFKYYNDYYNTTIYSNNNLVSFTNNIVSIKNYWPIIEINDDLLKYRYNMIDNDGHFNFKIFTNQVLSYKYNSFKKLKSKIKIKKKKIITQEYIDSNKIIEEATQDYINKISEINKLKYENGKLKFKQKNDQIVELQESIYNRVILRKFNFLLNFNNNNKNIFNFFFKKQIKLQFNKINIKKKNIFNFFKIKKLKKKNIFFFKKLKLNKNYFLRKYYCSYLKQNNFKLLQYINIKDIKKSIHLKLHLLNIYTLSKKTELSQRYIFIFTINNLILNMSYFYQYQYEKWLLYLIFSKINYYKWFKYYVLKKKFLTNNIRFFFNFFQYNASNIAKPTFLSKFFFSTLIYINVKRKIYDLNRFIMSVILKYFNKIYYTNYCFILEKFNIQNLKKKLHSYLYQSFKTIKFESIRAGFVVEFVNICALTFYSKDPKFLIKWIVKVLHKINYRKHWKFLYYLKYNIYKIASKFIKMTNFSGFNIIIKGKIGAIGSVRKKIVHINVGEYGFSKYYLRGDIYYLKVSTPTGVIGLRMIISYK